VADNSNWLSTPQGYATPEQIKSTYEYAKALMTGSGQQPVHHWTQGVSNIVSALVGGNLDYRANQMENAANRRDAGARLPQVNQPPFNESPSSGGGKKADASDDLGRSADAIASIESNGDYGSLGPTTRSGDRAYGKYQVMGSNVGPWTKEILGKEMTPDEFLKDREAQDAVFRGKFGQAMQKYGNPQDAASVWFTGRPYAQGANSNDGYINGAEYVRRFNKALGSPSSTATAFAGPDNEISQAPAVQAMSAALRGNPAPSGDNVQIAASGRVPAAGAAPRTALPEPAGGQTYIDPRLVQRVPQYSEDQVRAALASPRIPESAKQQILQQYMQQNQPVSVPYLGGAVIVDPRNPTRQQFIPQGEWADKAIGDIKHKVFMYPDGKGGVIEAPIHYGATPPAAPVRPGAPAVGPRGEAAPVVPQGATPGATPAGVPPIAQNTPASPVEAANAPVKVAALDPAAAMAAAAGKGATVPPGSLPNPGAPGAPAAPPAPLAQFAQAGPPPGVSPEDWAAYTQKKDYDIKKVVDEEAQKKGADAAAKKYDTLSAQAQSARKQMPNLDLGLALMNDPNFHSGMLSGLQDIWSRFKAATLGDKYANAPNEAFDKIMAGTILDNMKTALGGLGQVRLAEINLLTRANANRNNTDASNRAVLDVSRRAVQSIDHLDSMGQQYASGDEVTDPISGEVMLKANIGADGEIQPRHGLDVGFDKLARKFTLAHPSFTPEEIKRYETIFDTGRDPNEKAAPGQKAGEAAPQLPLAALSQLKAGTVTTFNNGQKWTLGPDGKPQQVK
jgi:hypothetical protein